MPNEAPHKSFTKDAVDTSLCLDRYARDETASLKRDIRRLTELLETER